MKIVHNFREVFLDLLIPSIYLIYFVLIIKTGSLPILHNLSLTQKILFVVLLLGVGLWLAGYFFIHPSVHLSPQAKELVTSGPYRFIRHPVYLGTLLVFLSLSLLTNSFPSFWYVILTILPINIGRAKWEEKILTEVFGKAYKRYKQKTFF